MRSVRVVVDETGPQDATKVRFIENDDVIRALALTAAGVGPGRQFDLAVNGSHVKRFARRTRHPAPEQIRFDRNRRRRAINPDLLKFIDVDRIHKFGGNRAVVSAKLALL